MHVARSSGRPPIHTGERPGLIIHGDLFDVLPTLEAESIDACVTDPPYDLTANKRGGTGEASLNLASPAGRSRISTGGGFMGKEWDATGVAFNPDTWREVYRVLKPGAHLLAFGGTRTFHRMTCAIEDAGFEIRDCLSWLYGQGFPKSLDVSKAIDAAAGAEREVLGLGKWASRANSEPGRAMNPCGAGTRDVADTRTVTAPSTDLAKQWQGWGTALKPAMELICMARKPLKGTVAANVVQFGTGALNIDACRIDTADDLNGGSYRCADTRAAQSVALGARNNGIGEYVQPTGRWPANVLLDEQSAALLDEQTGELTSGNDAIFRSDSGGPSRFFYVAKPSREERDYGCEGLPARSGGEATDRQDGSAGVNSPRAGAGRTGGSRNVHPTVKPVELMRWLVRLVTPPDGVVLDPFTGSGTTGMACRYELRRFIGIEREAEYVAIAERRIAAVAPLFGEETA